jgi:serine/threonine protein kinase
MQEQPMPDNDSSIPTRWDASPAAGRGPPPGFRPKIAGYQILDELGRGGMGVVYKAHEVGLGRVVALKVLHNDRQAASETVRRFLREAEASSRVLHPHIVLIYTAGQDGEHHFLAMEYVEGVDLERLVRETGPLSVAQACDYMRQAALGLQHAHERGLIHRDVKPTNLMVTPPPPPGPGGAGRGLVKILDLGLARLYRPMKVRVVASTLTHEGAFLGTPDFVAPEQAKDPRKIDHRADLYSLGCTFYFLLTGRVPFAADVVSEKLYQHWTAEPAPLDQLRPDVPAAVVAVVRRLMAKRPEDRYASAAELAASLEQIAARENLPATAPPHAEPTPSTRRQTQAAAEPVAPSIRPELLCRYDGHLDWVTGVAFTPDGQRALSSSLDGSLRLWEVVSGRELRRFARHAGAVAAVGLSPNGRYAVSGGADRTVRVWDVDTAWELRSFTGHTEPVTAVAFMPDGHHVVSAGQDRTLRLWEIDGGQETRRFVGHRAAVNALAVTPDGRRLLSAGNDRTLRLWDVPSGQEIALLGGQSATEQGALLTSVVLMPDGRQALSGGSDHALGLWDLEKRRRLQRFTGHGDWITCVALAPDGRRALSASGDRTVRLWDMTTGQELRRWPVEASALAFAPDGRRALVGSRDRSISLWVLPD